MPGQNKEPKWMINMIIILTCKNLIRLKIFPLFFL